MVFLSTARHLGTRSTRRLTDDDILQLGGQRSALGDVEVSDLDRAQDLLGQLVVALALDHEGNVYDEGLGVSPAEPDDARGDLRAADVDVDLEVVRACAQIKQ